MQHGQASLEFISVYGGVLLFIAVTLVILYSIASFFNTSGFEARCTLFSIVDCSQQFIVRTSPAGTPQLKAGFLLKNTGVDTVNITELVISTEASGDPAHTMIPSTDLTIELTPGELKEVSARFGTITGAEKGEMVRFSMNGSYTVCRNGMCSNPFKFSGEMVGQVD